MLAETAKKEAAEAAKSSQPHHPLSAFLVLQKWKIVFPTSIYGVDWSGDGLLSLSEGLLSLSEEEEKFFKGPVKARDPLPADIPENFMQSETMFKRLTAINDKWKEDCAALNRLLSARVKDVEAWWVEKRRQDKKKADKERALKKAEEDKAAAALKEKGEEVKR